MTEHFDQYRVQYGPGALNVRAIRVLLTPGPADMQSGTARTVWDNPTLTFWHKAAILNGGVGKRYAPYGRCVYCDATPDTLGKNGLLSDEHIVPYGLGGRLVLPQSSCDACAKNTCRFEGKVLRQTLLAARAQVGIKTRTTLSAFPLSASIDGRDVIVDLPLAEHPTLMFLCNLKAPRRLKPRALADNSVSGFWVRTFGTPDTALRVAKTFISPPFDLVEFSQMLAKIAHSYAVATIGVNFRPLLQPLIRRKFPKAGVFLECFDLVGGDETNYAPENELHTLGHDVYDVDGVGYLVVAIRLFSSLGGPVYRVVVGEV